MRKGEIAELRSELEDARAQIRSARSRIEELLEDRDNVTSRAIARNSEYEREAAELREVIANLLTHTADQDATIMRQYADLEAITEQVMIKLAGLDDRIFYLHQLLTAIGAYSGTDPDVPRQLARTALEEVVDENFVWPDEEE